MIFLGDFGGNFLRMLIWSLRGGCLGKVKELGSFSDLLINNGLSNEENFNKKQ